MVKEKFLTGVCRFFIFSVLLSFVLVWTTHAMAADKVYHLKMQVIHTGGATLEYQNEFASEVRKNTGGKIDIKIFPSGALVPTPQMAQAVGDGTIDMAFSYGGYHAGWIDIANIECGLPMAWGNAAEAALFHFTYGFQKLAREAYAEKGIYWMTPVFEVPFLLISKKPVKSLDDLKGMKIRATAPIAAVLNQFDIPTVYLPSEEFYTSLATGVIDGIIYGSWYSYQGLKLQEQAKYVTDMKILYPMTSAIIINKKVWESLPEDLRGTLDGTAESFYQLNYFCRRAKDDVEARKQFDNYILPAEDVAKLTKAALVVWDKEAAKSERAAKAVDMLKALAKDSGRL